MTWKEKVKEYGGGDFTFLSEDGESIVFVVCGEPELVVGSYKGTESKKVACPVFTEDGFLYLVAGMRLFRKLAKQEQHFSDTAFIATRHGEAGNPNATYELQVLNDMDLTAKLIHLRETEYKEEQAVEALEALKKVVED